MDNVEILNNIKINGNKISENAENSAVVQYAIYDKTIEKIKNEKYEEMVEFFNKKLNYYNRTSDIYESRINKDIGLYMKQMEMLINGYDQLFRDVLDDLQKAYYSQAEAVNNLILLSQKFKNGDINEIEKDKFVRVIEANAQKKLNYGVMIAECKARLRWCVNNFEYDINDIFKIDFYQVVIFDNSFLGKLKRHLIAIFAGKSSFEKFLNEYEIDILNKLNIKNEQKIANIFSTIHGVKEQMNRMETQIENEYIRKIA